MELGAATQAPADGAGEHALEAGYGAGVLGILDTVHAGYDTSGSPADLIGETVSARVDGAVFEVAFSGLYNRLLGRWWLGG